jgi:PadR family transcriptional regulator PadR
MVPVVERKPLPELRRGVVEHCVLALLRDGESYAFELARVLSERDLVASEGTIYPLLARLRREELVTTAWRESTAGPPRRYYRLTERGATVLAEFVVDWTVFRAAVDALLDTAAGGTKE